MTIDNELKRESRWVVMLALYHARELGLSDRLIERSLEKLPHLRSTITTVQEMLHYLKALELAEVTDLIDGSLHAKRTAKCVDVVEYNAPCPESIARPADKWW